MTFTIYKPSDNNHFTLGTTHILAEDFYNRFFPVNPRVYTSWQSWNHMVLVDIPTKNLYEDLAEVASFVNNELGEEFMLEVD